MRRTTTGPSPRGRSFMDRLSCRDSATTPAATGQDQRRERGERQRRRDHRDREEVEDQSQEHMVLEEVQKGYKLFDKLLRTSKVVIGICKAAEQESLDLESIKQEVDEEVEIENSNQNNNLEDIQEV